MYKTATMLLALSAAPALAQQKLPVASAPITIDGVTTPNGMVTINGKNYVSIDALRARGATVLKTGSLGLYMFPNAQGQSLKLKGCANEWLFNGVDRLRLQQPVWDAAAERWLIRFEIQTPYGSDDERGHFTYEKAIATHLSGKIFQPSKDPIQKIMMDTDELWDLKTGSNNPGSITLKDPNETTGSDPIVKFVMPGGPSQSSGKNTLTFDLTCKK